MIFAATLRVALLMAPVVQVECGRMSLIFDEQKKEINGVCFFSREGNFIRWSSDKESGTALKILLKPAEGFYLGLKRGRKKILYRGNFELLKRGKKILVVNIVDVEKYLYGVLPQEISPTWPMEALKAQAVAARTFAYYKLENPDSKLYDLDDSMYSQVYRGFSGERDRTNKAVDLTKNQVMTYRGRIIIAYYHACSGGITEDPRYAWGKKIPYLKSVSSPCEDSPHYKWKKILTAKYLARKLGVKDVSDIKVVSRTPSGRAAKLMIVTGDKTFFMSGTSFRQKIGVFVIKSTLFEVYKQGDRFIFEGRGWGHGVGMCQWGARSFALRGWDYKRILKYYYPGVKIITLE